MKELKKEATWKGREKQRWMKETICNEQRKNEIMNEKEKNAINKEKAIWKKRIK